MLEAREIAKEIVAREGGFVNDPDDPGGATNYGVTIHTMRRLGLDLDRDGDVDVADVRKLSYRQAVDIFVDHYFIKPRISELPSPVRASVFDMYVNAGRHAVKILQRLVNEIRAAKGLGRIAVDGMLGPQTIGAVEEASKGDPLLFADAYAIARRNYYYRLADMRPASRKYARRRDGGKGGWITRAEEFMRADKRLTDAQHRARTRGWT